MKIYTYDETLQASLSYFNGEELPAKVFVDKYALRDNEGNILEKTPDDMHSRIAKEFARIEAKKFSEPLSEGDIFNLLKDFKYIVPQGSPMYGIGNPHQYVSLSNCFDKDTNVFTVNSGVKKICDVSIGDKVVTHKGTVENVEQIHKNKLSNRTVFKLKCFGTPEIKVTDNHKFLSISKEQLKWGEKPSWNTVEYLRSGDYIAIPKRNDVGIIKDINLNELFGNYLTYGDYSYIVNKNYDENKINLIYCYKPNHKKKHKEVNSNWKVDENFARFLGLWYGDGCIFSDSKTKDKIRGITFTFNSKEEEIIKFVSNYGSSLFGLIPDINDNTKIDGSTQIVFHSGIIGYTFDKLFGRGCNGKRLNNDIYSWPKKLIENLLIGLIESDGCVTSGGSTRVVLNNRNLIESFYHLLRSHGILACITHGLPPGDYSRLSFTNNSYLKKFCKKNYFDDRLNYESKNKHQYSIEIDGIIYVRINEKEKIKYNEEYVYTLGISNTHSYNVEGLISLNCFVINSPADSYGGIHHTDEQLSHVSKRRGGIGIDISNLRPEGSPTKNSSRTSTGILSFMERYSNSIREVGQYGRRGAMLLTLDVHHPQVLDFTTVKNDRTKVTGANISLRLSDEFLNAVQNDEDYELRFPVDSKTPKISKKTKAKEVWKAIIKNAHEMAEPGLVFWDTILRNSLPDCYAAFGFKTESLNPCQPGHTKILTESGIKNLSDINIGDYIWSKEGWTKVLNKWSNGVKDVYKYSTTAGCVYCTKNHRLVVDDKNTKVEAQYAKTINIFISETELKTFDIKSSEYSSTEEVFDITVDNKSNSYWSNGCDVSNCGEICLSIYDSCRLLLLNLYSYVDNPFTANAKFNYKKFLSHAIIAQRLMDDLIDLEIESIDRILNKIENDPEPLNIKQREIELWQNIKKYCELGRRTGTGITALGDAIAACGFKYDSDESLQTVEKIYKTLKFGCYLSSIEMAKELGPFPVFNYELEKDCEFLKRMEDESLIIDEDLTLYGKDILNAMKKYGRRNIALLTTSPAGTVSILTQTTSGIEPVFMTHYFRKKKGNLQDENFRCDFTDQNGDMWMEFPVYHPKLKEWMRITGETDITKSPYYGACANDINWRKRVELQALAGKHVDHSISSTINLPNNVSVEEVATIYETAWKTGTIKGITVYRDGCRTGVLTAEKSSEIKKPQEVIRPKALDCEVHHVTVKGTQYFVLLGILNNKIYEVFAGKNGVLDKSIKNAKIVKKRGGHYHLVAADDTKEIYLAPITVTCNEEEEAVTRLTSLLLRSGTELHEIVLQLEKVSGNISSFSKAIARVLKKHIPDDTIVKEKCPECGAESMVRQEGCVTCKNCGYSKC